MSDTKSTDDKTLGVNKKTLTLKRPGVEQSTVRQNFSHGRTKSVVVETKKRKFSLPDQKPEVAPPVVAAPAPTPAAAPAAPVRPAPQPAAPQPNRCTGAASGGSCRIGSRASDKRTSRRACPAAPGPAAASPIRSASE